MVSHHALKNPPFSRQSSWPTVTENDLRDNSAYSDLNFARLQSWGLCTSHASQAQNTNPSPSKATYPCRSLAIGNERSYTSDAVGPSSTMTRPCTGLQGPSCAESGVSSMIRPPAVRNPTGAPLYDRLPVASKSLLSPINLETFSEKGKVQTGYRDPGLHASDFDCNEDFPNNCRPRYANSRSLTDTIDDSPVQSKSADRTKRKIKSSVLQDENVSTSSSQRRSPSPRPGIIERELLQREIQECLVKATRMQALKSGGFGEESTILIERGPFVSGSGSRPAAVEGGTIQRAHNTTSGYFPPCCGVPESALKTTKQSGRVEKAHSTTVTSPSRPQIVTISRRGSSARPLLRVDNRQPSSQLSLDYLSVTSPGGPTTTPTTNRQIYELDKKRRVSKLASANPKPPITPPNSPIERRGAPSKFSYPKVRSKDSKIANCGMKRYQPATWILEELEFLVSNFPLTRLQLDSPVIQHIRREIIYSTRSPCADPPLALQSIPHSRYSTRGRDLSFRTLSSRSLRHSSAEGFSNAELCGLCSSPSGSPRPIPSSMSTTLYALRTVFPHAASHTLDCVQATCFALIYISSVCFSHMVPSAASHVPNPTSMLVGTCCNVPNKAREMLGLKVRPEPSSSGTSWLRPQTPEYLDDDQSVGRLESLTRSLTELFRDLLAEIGGRRVGTGDDSLARAVQELIRLSESEGVGVGEQAEAGDGDGGEMGLSAGKEEKGYGDGCLHEWSPDVR